MPATLEGISSIIPENEQTEQTPDNNISRRDFIKLGAATTLGVASIATEAAILQNTDPTLNNHVSSLIEDTSRVLTTEPGYAPTEYSNLYNEHSGFIAASEQEWSQVLAPGLDKFFNLYFGKSLAEGLQTIEPIANSMGVDKRNLLVAGAFWGEGKIRTEGRVLLEDATNVAQTIISAKLDSNIIDKAFHKAKPIQSIYDSSNLDKVAPQYLRAVGSKRLRSVGPNDADVRTYANSITEVAHHENLDPNYFGGRFFNGAEQVTKYSNQLDEERKKNKVSNSTVSNFMQSAKLMEENILKNESNLEFGSKLFVASVRLREYLILEELGLDNFENLDEEQRAVVELALLTSMDDYPHKPELEFDPKYDGQFSRPEEIVPAVLSDMQKMEYVDLDTMLDPSIWNWAIQKKVEFLRKLGSVSTEN